MILHINPALVVNGGNRGGYGSQFRFRQFSISALALRGIFVTNSCGSTPGSSCGALWFYGFHIFAQ